MLENLENPITIIPKQNTPKSKEIRSQTPHLKSKVLCVLVYTHTHINLIRNLGYRKLGLLVKLGSLEIFSEERELKNKAHREEN